MTNPKTITQKDIDSLNKMMKDYPDSGYLDTLIFKTNGKPYNKHEISFHEGEKVVVKNKTFVVKYINESCIVLEPADCTIKASNWRYV